MCYTSPGVEGCTDPTACNFDEAATGDDGSCIAETSVYLDADSDGVGAGPALSSCTHSGSEFVQLDGDCDDNNASIYPGAPGTMEGLDNDCNGSIEGDEAAEAVCPGDLNNDGTVAMSDFLIFLGDFGCSGTCVGDMNGDQTTSTADMLVLLGLFGTSCF